MIEGIKMKKWTSKKIIIIISIIIIGLGIIAGVSLSIELMHMLPTEKIYVDGSDFSGVIQISGVIGSIVMGLIIVFCSIFMDILIWIIYGIVLFIIKKVHKMKKVN